MKVPYYDAGIQKWCVWLTPNTLFTTNSKQVAEAMCNEAAVEKHSATVSAVQAAVQHTGGSAGFFGRVAEKLRATAERAARSLSVPLREMASRSQDETTPASYAAARHARRVREAIREGTKRKVMLNNEKNRAAVSQLQLCKACHKAGCKCEFGKAERSGAILLPNDVVLLRPGAIRPCMKDARLGATERV